MEERINITKRVLAWLRGRKPPRAYANYWEIGSPDKRSKECDVVRDLIQACIAGGGPAIRNLQPGPDPPDCVAADEAGGLVGIEVCELVDEATVRRNAAWQRETVRESGQRPVGAVAYMRWTPESFRERLTALFQGKDGKPFLGGPYARRLLIIHTDEPELGRVLVDRWLDGLVSPAGRQLDEAYLLLSYDPAMRSYPAFKLPIRRQS